MSVVIEPVNNWLGIGSNTFTNIGSSGMSYPLAPPPIQQADNLFPDLLQESDTYYKENTSEFYSDLILNITIPERTSLDEAYYLEYTYCVGGMPQDYLAFLINNSIRKTTHSPSVWKKSEKIYLPYGDLELIWRYYKIVVDDLTKIETIDVSKTYRMTSGKWDGPYADTINTVSSAAGVDPRLTAMIIKKESGFNAKALNKKSGCSGLMQILPSNNRYLGITNAYDYLQNIQGGVKLFSEYLKQVNGDVRFALAAYNWGPGNVEKAVRKYGREEALNHAPTETKDYVQKIIEQWEALGGNPADPTAPVVVEGETQGEYKGNGFYQLPILGPWGKACIGEVKITKETKEDIAYDNWEDVLKFYDLKTFFFTGVWSKIEETTTSNTSTPTSTTSTPTTDIQKLTSEQIEYIQQQLKNGGYYGGVVNGIYSIEIGISLKNFKTAAGLSANTSYDQETSDALYFFIKHQSGGRQISEHFNEDEFACHADNSVMVQPKLIKLLEQLRNAIGVGVNINSGYRTPEYNATLSGAALNSYHIKGMAADISPIDGSSSTLQLIASKARELGFGGVALYSSGFVHVDTGPKRDSWTGA